MTLMEDLMAALAQAEGGETITLAPGDYGPLILPRRWGASLSAPVTLQSASKALPAVFSELQLTDGGNLRFVDVTFRYVWKDGDVRWHDPFAIPRCANMEFRGCAFIGDLAWGGDPVGIGYATARGLLAGGNTNLTFANNTMQTFWKGLAVSDGTNVSITGNEFHSIRSDGLNCNAVQHLLIEANHFHDFVRAPDAGDHADFIQFASTGATRTTADVVIRGNLFDIGDGGKTQCIFMRNDIVDKGLAGYEMFWRDIVIDGNTIYADHTHAIAVGETDGLAIRDNVILHKGPPPERKEIPRISVNEKSLNVTITGNTTFSVPAAQDGWVVEGNTLVDPR